MLKEIPFGFKFKDIQRVSKASLHELFESKHAAEQVSLWLVSLFLKYAQLKIIDVLKSSLTIIQKRGMYDFYIPFYENNNSVLRCTLHVRTDKTSLVT